MAEVPREKAERLARERWNAKADEYNQWAELGGDEREELIAEVIAEQKESGDA